jgi:hypothetical protein
MSTLTKEMLPFKLRAKRHRGNMITALANGDRSKAEEEFRSAETAIEEAFQYLAKYERPDPETPGHASEGEITVAEQLADFWGIRGGLYRSRGSALPDGSGGGADLETAIQAYDRGARYESSERFGLLNSYNTVNRLVLRIIRQPDILNAEEAVPGDRKRMADLLEDAAKLIEAQLDKERKDLAWALADLAMIELLCDGIDLEPILEQLDEATVTDKYPLESMLNVIRDLLRAGIRPRGRFVQTGERIRGKLPEPMKGPAFGTHETDVSA